MNKLHVEPEPTNTWCAYYDPEPGNLVGRGNTREEAVTDLLEQTDEKWGEAMAQRNQARGALDRVMMVLFNIVPPVHGEGAIAPEETAQRVAAYAEQLKGALMEQVVEVISTVGIVGCKLCGDEEGPNGLLHKPSCLLAAGPRGRICPVTGQTCDSPDACMKHELYCVRARVPGAALSKNTADDPERNLAESWGRWHDYQFASTFRDILCRTLDKAEIYAKQGKPLPADEIEAMTARLVEATEQLDALGRPVKPHRSGGGTSPLGVGNADEERLSAHEGLLYFKREVAIHDLVDEVQALRRGQGVSYPTAADDPISRLRPMGGRETALAQIKLCEEVIARHKKSVPSQGNAT